MNILLKLSLANLKHRSARTFYLTALTVLMSFSVFIGSVIINGLNGGLQSLRDRLGADIIVIPEGKSHQQNFEGILLGGRPGYFYMSGDVMSELSVLDGVDKITSQFYLASLTADCCSTEMQLMGFDPETDFIVTPWLAGKYGVVPAAGEVIAGSEIFVPKTGIIKIYNQDIRVVGSMEKTGTGMDFAVFCNSDTVKHLLKSAQKLGVASTEADPEKVVSSVMIKVKKGWDKSELADLINRKVSGVRAFENRDMIASFASKLESAVTVVKVVVAFIWILSLTIINFSFSMVLNERKNEFAVLKILGFTPGTIFTSVLYELLIICGFGAVIGVLLSSLWALGIKSFLETGLRVPFLFENFGSFVLHGGYTILAAAAVSIIFMLPPLLRALKTGVDTVMRE